MLAVIADFTNRKVVVKQETTEKYHAMLSTEKSFSILTMTWNYELPLKKIISEKESPLSTKR